MKKKKNVVWRFFASVKLALFTLFTLAAASIIGTLIPQNDEASKYVELYGPSVANIFLRLEFDDMYSSTWFTSLLVLFSLNLTVCTIERFPHIWKIVTIDNLATKIDRLKKMAMRKSFTTTASIEQSEAAVEEILPGDGWKIKKTSVDDGTLFFAQKGAWTRLAVIVVHVSILVIFTGSLIGNFFGYKASVMIPEGSTTDKVYQSNSDHTPIPMGFTVTCNAFSLTYYDTGAPKEFRSDLVVKIDGNEVQRKSIVVNDPMKYGGLTFYQSSYQAMDGQFTVTLDNTGTGSHQMFGMVPRREMRWDAEKVKFGITSISGPDFMRKYRYKIWFDDANASPVEFWVDEDVATKVKRAGAVYEINVKPRFATGLQVVKDPGVWTVYIGCGLMILGLVIIFFMSHRRIWVFVAKDGKNSSILLSGNANKNKIGFEKDMANLVDSFEEHKALGLDDNEA
jgi:cytochrome c biogenesis protein